MELATEIKFVNCTPHVVDIVKEDGSILSIEPSGIVPRCTQLEDKLVSIYGFTITRQTFGKVIGLPEAKIGVYLIVSRLVASAAKDRTDLLVPGPMVRGEDGRPCGCRGLSVIY